MFRNIPALYYQHPIRVARCDGKETNYNEENVHEHGGLLRLIGYLRAAVRVVKSGTRYMAYTSDVGEAFRPLLHPRFVQGAYAISWSYVVGDVAYHGYKEYKRGSDAKTIGVKIGHAAVFQSIASMAVPTLVIHTVVHRSHHLLEHHGRNLPKMVKSYTPSALGLACIPLLPLVDEPLESIIDSIFIQIFPNEMIHHHSHPHSS